jgi:alpha-L-arabinofuranosidase
VFTRLSSLALGFYATRISSKLGWIYSVIDPTGSLVGDGISNLLKYALNLDPLTPGDAGLPTVASNGKCLSLTYTQVLSATDITYTVEQSTDLINWSTANAQDEVIATNNGVQTIKASVAMGTNNPLFLRLRVARP